MLKNTCSYPYVFETAPLPGSEKLRNLDQIPRPYVIEPPQGKSRRPPPQLFAPFGGRLVARTYKPDGELCDEIYRLCTGPACGPH